MNMSKTEERGGLHDGEGRQRREVITYGLGSLVITFVISFVLNWIYPMDVPLRIILIFSIYSIAIAVSIAYHSMSQAS